MNPDNALWERRRNIRVSAMNLVEEKMGKWGREFEKYLWGEKRQDKTELMGKLVEGKIVLREGEKSPWIIITHSYLPPSLLFFLPI